MAFSEARRHRVALYAIVGESIGEEVVLTWAAPGSRFHHGVYFNMLLVTPTGRSSTTTFSPELYERRGRIRKGLLHLCEQG